MDALAWTAWIDATPRRKTVLQGLARPLTATQLAKPTGLTRAACSSVLSDLAHRRLARCLSPAARRSRVYGLTRVGKALRDYYAPGASRHHHGPIDWSLFGWVCFRHRAAIVRALSAPMQPAEIKRRALSQDGSLRVSAGNIRDVIKLFLRRGIVSAVMLRKRSHPRYELTPVGRRLRELLISAESPGPPPPTFRAVTGSTPESESTARSIRPSTHPPASPMHASSLLATGGPTHA